MYTCNTYERDGKLDLDRECGAPATHFWWSDRLGPTFSCMFHVKQAGAGEQWEPIRKYDPQKLQELKERNEALMKRIFPDSECGT